MATAAGTMQVASTDGEEECIRLIVQRCGHAELLVDNDADWRTMEQGLIAYVSFSTACTIAKLDAVVKTLFDMPVLTTGVWGDGTKPRALKDFALDNRTGLMLIPQAGLFSKLKGKYLQYRQQCGKEKGAELYAELVARLRKRADQLTAPKTSKPVLTEPEFDLDIEPTELFRTVPKFADRFAEFDAKGLPTKMKNDSDVPKGELKKLKKTLAKHVAHRKAKAEAESAAVKESEAPMDDSKGVYLIAGTFGNRQGLRVTCEAGPFTHMFTF